MTTCGEAGGLQEGAGPIGWVVPGSLRQVTGGYLYDARIVDGLRARGRPVGVIDVRAAQWPLDVTAGRRLTRALRRHPWAAVVVDELAHPALAAASLAGGLGGALAGAPLVLLVHHLRCSEPGSRPARTVARVVETAALRVADLIVCTSDTTACTVRSLVCSGVPVEVVRPGWDTHPNLTPPTGAKHRGAINCAPTGAENGATAVLLPPLRAGEGGRGGEFRLLLVGHWTPRKGILEALDAVGRVRAAITLDLVGEQSRDPAYMTHVLSALNDPALAGRVRVHGRVPSDTLARLYAEADGLLLPSTHEGYGMVLAEALAAGLPIVATRVGAIPEVVRDGQEAALVPPGDLASLARAIARLAAGPDERRRRSALAREHAASLPRWSDSIATFDDLLARHGI